MYQSLPPAVQTAYLDLLAATISAPIPGRGVSFIKRSSRGQDYWYLQYVIGESKQSFYLGPDDEHFRDWIARAKALKRDDAEDLAARERLVAVVAAGGMQVPTATEARVYEALAQAGVFAGGGVLVGSHAFANIGNMLGVRWDAGITRTSDIDIARDPEFVVAAPQEETDLEALLRESNKAFFAVPALNPKNASTTWRIRGRDLAVSLLTPMKGNTNSKPVSLPQLKAAAEPVRYLEFVMQDAQLAAVPARAGILVRVPDPARFALHKLVVSQRRSATFAAKARKDIAQANAVMDVLRDLRPGDIRNAFNTAKTMGAKFMQQLRNGSNLLSDSNRALLENLDPH